MPTVDPRDIEAAIAKNPDIPRMPSSGCLDRILGNPLDYTAPYSMPDRLSSLEQHDLKFQTRLRELTTRMAELAHSHEDLRTRDRRQDRDYFESEHMRSDIRTLEDRIEELQQKVRKLELEPIVSLTEKIKRKIRELKGSE